MVVESASHPSIYSAPPFCISVKGAESAEEEERKAEEELSIAVPVAAQDSNVSDER